MKQILFPYSLLLITILGVACQQPKSETSGYYINEVDSLLVLARNITSEDPSLAEKSIKKALYLSQLSHYQEGEALALAEIASVDLLKGAFDESQHYLDSAIALSLKIDNPVLVANLKQKKGYIFFLQSNFWEAFSYYTEALKYYEKSRDSIAQSEILTKIGMIYYDKMEYDKALEYYNRSLDISLALGKEMQMAREMNNIGSVLETQSKYSEAYNYFQEALKLNSIAGRKAWIAINLHNIAKIQTQFNENEEAIKNYKKAIETDSLLNNEIGVSEDLYSYAAHLQKNELYAEALPILERSAQLCKKNGNLTTLCRVYNALFENYEHAGAYKQALQNHLAYTKLSDTLFGAKKSRAFIELEMAFASSKTRAIEEKRDVFYTNIVIISLSILAVSLLIITTLFYRKRMAYRNSVLQKQLLQTKLSNQEAKMINEALHNTEKNAALEEIKNLLVELERIVRKSDQEHIRKIIFAIRVQMNDNIWTEFDLRFKEVNPMFYKKLKAAHPDLTPNETRLCAFLHMNMNTKEIAAVTHRSPKTINVARTRLRKKLTIKTSDTNISEYLARL